MDKKILIVDDDELTVHLLTSRLEEADYIIISATTGQAALELVLKEKPDIVIMDIMLPDMQGSDVVRELDRHSAIAEDMKVIFLSGIISSSEEEGQSLQVGQRFYPAIAKPVDFKKLLAYF